METIDRDKDRTILPRLESFWRPFLPPTPSEGHIIPLNLPIYPYCLAISVIALNENRIYPIPGYKRFSFSVEGPDYPIASLSAPSFYPELSHCHHAWPRCQRAVSVTASSPSLRNLRHRLRCAISVTAPSVSPLSPRYRRHCAIGVTAFATPLATLCHRCHRFHHVIIVTEPSALPRHQAFMGGTPHSAIYISVGEMACGKQPSHSPQMRSTNARTRVAK